MELPDVAGDEDLVTDEVEAELVVELASGLVAWLGDVEDSTGAAGEPLEASGSELSAQAAATPGAVHEQAHEVPALGGGVERREWARGDVAGARPADHLALGERDDDELVRVGELGAHAARAIHLELAGRARDERGDRVDMLNRGDLDTQEYMSRGLDGAS